MNPLLTILSSTDSFQSLYKAAAKGFTLPALATGVSGSQKWHVAAGLIETGGRPALIVAASELKAKEIYEDLYFYFKDDICLFPSRDVIFYAADVKSVDITRQRLLALDALRHKPPGRMGGQFAERTIRPGAVSMAEASRAGQYSMVRVPAGFSDLDRRSRTYRVVSGTSTDKRRCEHKPIRGRWNGNSNSNFRPVLLICR